MDFRNNTKNNGQTDREPNGTRTPGQAAVAYQFQTDQVRTIQIGDTVWFAAPDVCKILGLKNVSRALSRLTVEEKSFADLVSSGQIRQTAMVDESGLIALALSSRKPEAIKFRRWITKDVLPSIWRTGSYTLPNSDAAIEHNDIADIINRRTGIYLVVVDGAQRTIQETETTEIMNIVNNALSTMMASALIEAQGALTFSIPEGLLLGTDNGFAADSLRQAVGRGADVASRYLKVSRFRADESDAVSGGLHL